MTFKLVCIINTVLAFGFGIAFGLAFAGFMGHLPAIETTATRSRANCVYEVPASGDLNSPPVDIPSLTTLIAREV